MMASYIIMEGEKTILRYSRYKFTRLNSIEFMNLSTNALVMTEYMHKIEFKNVERSTITDFKSHSILGIILESLIPWNIAWKNLIQKFISDLFQMFSKNRGIYFLQIYPEIYYSLTHYFNHIDVPRGTIDISITSKISYLSI